MTEEKVEAGMTQRELDMIREIFLYAEQGDIHAKRLVTVMFRALMGEESGYTVEEGRCAFEQLPEVGDSKEAFLIHFGHNLGFSPEEIADIKRKRAAQCANTETA